ncbi:MAG: hypothetical protein POELPBGB_02527 [Bacteroidia bacterium]|nr:hypothetical protein [Bacteroidia bacterium]
MNRTQLFIAVFFSILISAGGLLYFDEIKKHPAPAEIKESDEMKQRRKEWWEKKHGAAEGVDWKAMDEKTRKERAENRNQQRKELYKKGQLKSNEKILETLGNGSLTGEWRERGSTNIAGRMHTCDIDFETNTVYAGSSGGVLWKGTLDGENWQPLNDYMTNEIIFVRHLELQSGNRLYMAGGKYFYYSDNDGLTWETATGLESLVDWGNVVRVVVTSTEPKLFYTLVLEWDYGPAWEPVAALYRSDDMGETFTRITSYSGWAGNTDIWTARYGTSGNVYLINDADFYQLDNAGQPVFVANIGSSGGEAVLTGMEETNGTAKLAVFSNGEIYRSDNSGLNWTYTGDEPDWLWGRHSFVCSLNNPDRLYFGGINCNVSNDAGVSWFPRNEWYDYYGQERYQLHADIDGIDIFYDTLGNELIMVSTDGGLYKSYDQLSVVDNISMHGLRTGQFYSTYTNRTNTNYIYMGSQDQGFQKCRVDSGGVLGFKQSISGDYGSIVSGDNGNSLWTVYPGFAMYYPEAADVGDFAAFWDFVGDGWQWMAPMMADPYDYNYAFTGGGDSAVSGQYLWHLQHISGNIEAERLPYNFSINNTNEITAVAYSPIDWNYRYVLTNRGRFFYSDDEGQTWTLSNTFNEADFRGNVIIPSPTHLSRVIIGGSGYSNAGVFISENHGQTFSALDNNIPQTSFNDLKLSSTELLLFAATDVGPYCYNFNTQEWFDMAGITAPDQNYTSVDFIPSLNVVRFGTYGRGTWDFAITDEPLVSVAENNVQHTLEVFPNPFSEATMLSFTLKQLCDVTIDVYDIKGQKVFTEHKEKLTGEQRISLNRSALQSGVYLVSISAGNEKLNRKIIIE